MGYILVINGVYWVYNRLTNLLLTSWDILVHKTTSQKSFETWKHLQKGMDKNTYLPEV